MCVARPNKMTSASWQWPGVGPELPPVPPRRFEPRMQAMSEARRAVPGTCASKKRNAAAPAPAAESVTGAGSSEAEPEVSEDHSLSTCRHTGCAFLCTGLIPNYCCKKCAAAPGMHGPKCKRSSSAQMVATTPSRVSQLCTAAGGAAVGRPTTQVTAPRMRMAILLAPLGCGRSPRERRRRRLAVTQALLALPALPTRRLLRGGFATSRGEPRSDCGKCGADQGALRVTRVGPE